jgi:hypothetical protein
MKFVVMAITTLAGRFFGGLVFFLPILYAFVTIATIYHVPYVFVFNTILDSTLYFFNLVFSLLPLMAWCQVHVSESIVTPFAVALFLIPVISVGFLIWRLVSDSSYDKNDLTMYRVSKDERKRRINSYKSTLQQRNKERRRRIEEQEKERRRRIEQEEMERRFAERLGTRLAPILPINYDRPPADRHETMEEIDEMSTSGFRFLPDLETLGNPEDKEFDTQDREEIRPSSLWSVRQCDEYQKKKGRPVPRPESEEDEYVEINGSVLTARYEAMYERLDILLDNATIEFLTSVLSWVMMFAAVAFGWFVGASITSDFGIYDCSELSPWFPRPAEPCW